MNSIPAYSTPSLLLARAAALLCALALAFSGAFCAVCATAFADAGSNELVDSCPEDGATGVPTSGRLWVRYANNIASVESNLELAALLDEGGEEVPEDVCQVSLPDYEVEFGYRQYFFFDVDGLEPGATYTIVIEEGVTARNGYASEEAVEIEFVTAAEGEEPAELEEPEEQARGAGGGQGDGSGSSAVSDIELVSWSVAGSSGDDARPTCMDGTMAHYAMLVFSENLSWYSMEEGADLSFLDDNAALVTLEKADGTPVEGVDAYSYYEEASLEEGVIYLDLEGWLDPLSDYQIVVEPGLTTYDGSAVSTERYVVEFRTDGQLSWGPTVFQVAAVVAVVACVAAGIVAQLVRRRRQRGGAR